MVRQIAVALATLAVAAGLAACGGGATAQRGRPVTLLMAMAPDSLDPAVGYTSEALEADWLVYTPLLTYNHSTGVPGTRLIPGVATDLPAISDAGKTYTLTLRKRLLYSNRTPVKTSDFAWAVERAIRLHWGGAPQFITNRIAGARAFAQGRARTISGIATDNATRQITIRLTAPYGGFENVLALPALAPVPTGTPFTNEAAKPPVGIGPYEFTSVVPGASFGLAKAPSWRQVNIPGIPDGRLGVHVSIDPDARSNAQAVLANQADVFDWADRIPSAMAGRVKRRAADRYRRQVMNATYLIFFNVTRPPFSSRLVREAVRFALDQDALNRIAAGTLENGCYLLPPSVYGHPHTRCPNSPRTGAGDFARAQALVKRSGTAGIPVTVWSEADYPFRQWMAYYTALLRRLGFKARQRIVADADYYATIGTLRLHPQTGFGDFYQDFPNPSDFYQWLTGAAIVPRGNQNWGEIDDVFVNDQVRILGAVPAANLSAVSGFWHTVEQHVASQAYLAVIGYQTFPELVSSRIQRRALVFSPVVGLDWSSLQLK